MSERPPSRALLIAAGVVTQVCAAACLVLGLASLPIVHDLHGGMHGVIAGAVAAFVAFVCGALVWGGRLVPLALAAGLDLGFGIALPRGSAIGALLRLLPGGESATAVHLVDALAIAMFAATVLCIGALPSALARRRWVRDATARAVAEARERALQPADTLRGVGPAPATVTLQVRPGEAARRSRPAVVIAVAALLVLVGGIAMLAATGGGAASDGGPAARGSASGSARAALRAHGDAHLALDAMPVVAMASGAPAGDAAAGEATGDAAGASIDALVAQLDAALGRATPDALAPLLAADAFGLGIGAHEIAQGAPAVAAALHADLGGGGAVDVRFSHAGHDGDVAWLAQDVTIGGQPFVLSAVAGLDRGAWQLHAISLAVALSDDDAHRLARDGELPVPDAIPDAHDDSPLAHAMRDALASLPSFVAARSRRDDAFNFGSAGERLVGGDGIAHVFSRLRATLRLHDAVAVGAVGARGGWGAANVDFRTAGDVTQTFRVLAAWVQEDAGWRIVQTQFSNAK